MRKIIIIISTFLLTSCMDRHHNHNIEDLKELMEACYWLGQIDYHRGIIKFDTTTYQLKNSLFEEDNPPKFCYGKSKYGKMAEKKFKNEFDSETEFKNFR